MRVATIQGEAIEDGGASILARLYGIGGSLVTQASLSTIRYYVYDVTSGGTLIATGDSSIVIISSCVFDTIQGANLSDIRWTADLIGFNFAHPLPESAFPTGGHLYQVEYKFTPTTGAVFWGRARVKALPLFTS